jgi:hypothetical protein
MFRASASRDGAALRSRRRGPRRPARCSDLSQHRPWFAWCAARRPRRAEGALAVAIAPLPQRRKSHARGNAGWHRMTGADDTISTGRACPARSVWADPAGIDVASEYRLRSACEYNPNPKSGRSGTRHNRGRQLRRPYFFMCSGKTAASGTISIVRPPSSMITKASGTVGLPSLIASARSSRAASMASCRAVAMSGKSMPFHRVLVRHLHEGGNRTVSWPPHFNEVNLTNCRLFRLLGSGQKFKTRPLADSN